jgi:hypothetical protein
MKQKHQEDLSQLLYDGALLKVLYHQRIVGVLLIISAYGGVLKCFFFRLKVLMSIISQQMIGHITKSVFEFLL